MLKSQMTLIERIAYLIVISVLTALLTAVNRGGDDKFCIAKGKQEKFVISAANDRKVTCYIKYDEATNSVMLTDCGAWE